MKVFIYGSLLRSEYNHNLLEEKAEFLYKTETEAGYYLVDIGRYPALVKGGNQKILGELYNVLEHFVPWLDDFEDHPYFYQRQNILLKNKVKAEAYILDQNKAKIYKKLKESYWPDYRKKKF